MELMRGGIKPANADRLIALDEIFGVPHLKAVWSRTVRDGLRRQAIRDLHDYMDVHRNKSAFFRRVRTDILSGNYRPSEPDPITIEKKLGLKRTLLIPSPADALVLQAIVDAVEGPLKKAQPHANAYYSRTHDGPSVEEFSGTFGYPWWRLWPEFQKKVWQFARSTNWTVSTDVANYFDTIPLQKLRNTLSGLAKFEESALDFIFYVLEAFVWRPEYIPSSGVGLPQINFDAPRLLAHAYLFPADRLLHKETNGNFVRWMDDIDFGTDSEEGARRILGDLDRVLATLGIRLNAGKTKIMSPQEAFSHFWISENTWLNVIRNTLKNGSGSPRSRAHLLAAAKQRYSRFRRSRRDGQWQKIQKRFVTIFSELKANTVQREVPALLRREPALREPLLRYYLHLGFSPSRLTHLIEFLESGYAVDDASVFGTCLLLVDWQIPRRSLVIPKIANLAHSLGHAHSSTGPFAGGLWLLAKYGNRNDVQKYVRSYRYLWTRSDWAARQVAGAYPLMNATLRAEVYRTLANSGLTDSLQVVAHYEQLMSMQKLDKQLTSYLLYSVKPPYSYPLPKFLIAGGLLTGQLDQPEKARLQAGLAKVVQDPIYSFRLKSIRF
jgi:hypothetical protein